MFYATKMQTSQSELFMSLSDFQSPCSMLLTFSVFKIYQFEIVNRDTNQITFRENLSLKKKKLF